MMVGYGACGENKRRDRYRGRERDHDQSITAFLFASRAFGEADLGIKWVLIRELKLATMERLAEASLWCLANLSLEGVLCWLGLQEAHRMSAQQLHELRIITWPALKAGFS